MEKLIRCRLTKLLSSNGNKMCGECDEENEEREESEENNARQYKE